MMVVSFFELGFIVADVLLIVVRVRELMQVAANRGLRLLLLRPDGAVQSLLATADIGISPEKVHRPSAEAKQLRHDRVVVVGFGKMAVGAILRRAHAAGGVREMGIECLAAVTLGRVGLLLGIHPLTIGILGADDDRA